jgi:cytochrome b involved in lipid metabolism
MDGHETRSKEVRKMESSLVLPIIIAAFVLIGTTLYFISAKSKSKAVTNKIPPKKPVIQKKSKEELKMEGPFSLDEIAKHNSSEDCWIIVDGKVYDVTEYIDEHPGGDTILNNAGGDSSAGVHGPQHPVSMWDVLALYYIGEVKA